MSSTSMGFQNKSLQQQGFRDYSRKQLTELQWGLRFTPAVCMLLAIYGLLTQQASVHFALTLLGMLPMFFPSHHPFDLFYNHVLRPLWGGVRLPSNPLPRRIACFAGGLMNLGVALAFTANQPILAFVIGGALIVLQMIVITTHFCVASWMYEGFLRLIGKWEDPAAVDLVKSWQAQGAVVVDVREPHEFKGGHVDCAANLPLSQLSQCVGQLEGKKVLVYCRSGMRSRRALSVLKAAGHSECHNLGGLERARQLLEERSTTP